MIYTTTTPVPADRASEELERHWGGADEVSSAPDVGERQAVAVTAEVVGVAGCPSCHAPLIARMRRRGPGFACLCPPRT